MKKIKLIHILILVLIAFQLYSLKEIKQLKTKLQQTDSMIAYIDNNLSNRINDIYSNVDTKLKEQASLVTNARFDVGEYDVDTLKVPFTFKIQPKVLTDTTKAFLSFSGEKVPMTRQGIEFILTRDLDIKDEIVPLIVIEDNGVSQFEENDKLALVDIRDQIFSSIYLHFLGSTQYSAEEPYEVKAEGIIEISSITIQNNNYFKDIKYVVSLDDKVVKTLQTDLTDVGSFEIKDDFVVEAGQTLIGKVVATDRMNMKHEYVIFNYVGGEDEEFVYAGQNEKILTPDGSVIYEAFGNDYY